MKSKYVNMKLGIHSAFDAVVIYLHQPAYKEAFSKIKTNKPMWSWCIQVY